MAFIKINEAQIYFETFGKTELNEPPILLIHGAPNTGKHDWEFVAPLLGRRWQVIVPDCRGHGRSSNPRSSYSFREMADDMQTLIKALGYERAHIIGHSNGGNIALVTLLEHPDAVQTAVLQAANAYVSPDLQEREPRIFDPLRVEKDDLEWMEKLITLHGPTHGVDYWRTLLQMTLNEIISEPNYTPDQLNQVQKPVLVIQGGQDSVNAPSRHAQFIANNIPYSERWLPSDVGHNVQKERLFEWIGLVESFLDRRGSAPGEAIHRLRSDRYADQRSTIFDIKVRRTEGKWTLSGRTLTAKQRQEAIEAAQSSRLDAKLEIGSIQVLLEESTAWALVKRGVTDVRREPHSLAERLSQALLGETVRVLEVKGEWSLVRVERDGYLGWIHSEALHLCSQAEADAYQSGCDVRVQAGLIQAYTSANGGLGEEAGKLTFGVKLPLVQQTKTSSQLRLPDGRLWWVESSGLLPAEYWPRPDPAGITFTLNLIKPFVGVPYQWGGRSPFGFDCSGFTAAFWGFLGISLPRDADQQFQAGKTVEGEREPGDLMFFGSLADEIPDTRQQDRFASITHVAVSLGGDDLIHSNGAAWGVSYNSIDPKSPRYRSWLREHFVGARRYS
jgi:gamma-D-glutamyl-L-lysine dipeptidyl-peptidase